MLSARTRRRPARTQRLRPSAATPPVAVHSPLGGSSRALSPVVLARTVEDATPILTLTLSLT
eukprot:4520548-Prorocentrum_lima.AAC.1